MEIVQKVQSCEEFDIYESHIDTQFFGVRSAKAVLKESCVDEKKQDEFLAFLNGFEFAMIANKDANPVNNRWIGEKSSAFLVDVNVQFHKAVTPVKLVEGSQTGDINSTISDCLPENDQIVFIAETYFQLSQFRNDPYLPQEKARSVYADIVKNAFNQQGRFFVVTKVADIVAGFILFVMNPTESSSTIQLIGVNQDFKRQGIGHRLVRSMENHLANVGIEMIVVGTQFNNFGAIKFYNANGFSYTTCSSIFHYWSSHPTP